jgi:hypothetical protein
MIKSGLRPLDSARRPSIQLKGGAMDTKPKDRPTDIELEKAVFEAP